eukprot:scaffold205_cov407-Prasinococcus_capsulatus_cf.AAC.5
MKRRGPGGRPSAGDRNPKILHVPRLATVGSHLAESLDLVVDPPVSRDPPLDPAVWQLRRSSGQAGWANVYTHTGLGRGYTAMYI